MSDIDGRLDHARLTRWDTLATRQESCRNLTEVGTSWIGSEPRQRFDPLFLQADVKVGSRAWVTVRTTRREECQPLEYRNDSFAHAWRAADPVAD